MIRNIKEQRFRKITTVADSVWMSIKTFAYVIILSPVILSCSFSDEYDDLQESTKSVNLNFTVSTRAGGDTETATAAENKINDCKIYFFNAKDDTYVATFTPNTMIADEDYANYSVSGLIDNDVISKLTELDDGFKIVFLGNWSSYPEDEDMENKTIEDLCKGDESNGFSAKFNIADIADSETGYSDISIPFYGVHTYKDVNFETDDITTLSGDIALLRALAKVEVKGSDITEGLDKAYSATIKEAKIVHYNAQGYCAPLNVYSEDSYSQTDGSGEYGLHLVGTDNTNDEQTESTTISMYHDTENDKWIAYIPEYDNYISTSNDEAADTCYIQIEYECKGDDDGTGKSYDYTEKMTKTTYTISFADYNDDGILPGEHTRYDIKRNELYSFEVQLPYVWFLVESSLWGEEWHVKRK